MLVVENEKLIQAITEEVMKRLMDMLKKQNFSQLLHKKSILIISNKEHEFLEKELSSLNFVVDYSFSMKNIEDYDFIIIHELNNLELVNLSLGLPGGDKEKLIIEGMLKGKKIGLLSEGIEFRNYKNTSNKNFYSMYETYEKKIIEFGINIVGQNSIRNFIEINDINKDTNCDYADDSIKCNEVEKIKSYIDLSNNKLISEVDLRRAIVNGNKDIRISTKAIVTPLAKDFIRMNKLNVIRE